MVLLWSKIVYAERSPGVQQAELGQIDANFLNIVLTSYNNTSLVMSAGSHLGRVFDKWGLVMCE